jgi:hypothetical protein
MVRDPVARTMSDYSHERYWNKTFDNKNMTFEESVMKMNNIDESSYIVANSHYDQQLGGWLKYFSLSQFHFVKMEELNTDPVHVLHQVEAFLGLPHELDESKMYVDEEGHYCYIDHPLLCGRYCLDATKHRDHPEVRQEVLDALKEYFMPHMNAFYNIIGRDMGWFEYS